MAPSRLCLSVKKNKCCEMTEICQTLLMTFVIHDAPLLKFLATPLLSETDCRVMLLLLNVNK